MGTPLSVLLVEDLENDAHLVFRQLQKAGYDLVSERVETADAMRAMLARQVWDLVISDYSLPGFNAPAAFKVLQETGQDIPFIVVSGTIGEEVAVAMMKTGVHDYLMKNNLARLAPAVERELKHAEQRRDRKRAVDALLASELQYRRLFESAKDGILILDAETGMIADANPFLVELLGYSEEQLRGKKIWELGFLRDILANQEMFHELRQKEYVRYDDLPLMSADGRQIDVEFVSNVYSVGNKSVVQCNIRDNTERKRTEEDLKLFRELIDRLGDSIELIDPESGRYLDVNTSTCISNGYTREELLSMKVMDLNVDMTSHASWTETVAEIRAAGSIVFQTAHRRKDGSIFPVEVSTRYTSLNRDYLIAVVRDITERMQREEKLQAAQRRLKRAVDAGNVGLWDWDLDTNDIYFSPQWKNQIGYEDDEIENEYVEWERRIHPDDANRIRNAIDEIIAKKNTLVSEEYRLRHKDGTYRWLLTSGEMFFDDQNRPVRMLGANVDITERKRLEEQFHQAQKMESIGRLAGGVAHDFNNLLTVINGYAETVLSALNEGDEMRADVQEIRDAGERAATLTRQLLAFSRKQVLQPEVLNLNTVVKSSEKMLQRLIGEDVRLVFQPAADLCNVKLDLGQIEQVIMNLAVNARDAMPKGGRLTIETKNLEVDAGSASLYASVLEGTYAQLTISDTGVGMDADTLNKIFEPFFTTKEVGKGTGLGLATVHGIIKQSGGNILVDSELGKRTTFRILLPRVQEEKRIDEAVALKATERGNETILVVEDEVMLRNLTQRILANVGYTVLSAANGDDALSVIERRGGSVDLMITDVVMPGLNGRELAERLSIIRPGLKVLYMSGYTDDAIVRHKVVEASMHFIGKPFTPAALTRKVREVLTAPKADV